MKKYQYKYRNFKNIKMINYGENTEISPASKNI